MKTSQIAVSLLFVSALTLAACSPDRTPGNGSAASSRVSSTAPDNFTTEPKEVTVEGETVLQFTYPTTREARLDAAKIADDGSRVGARTLPWNGTPHFFRKENVMMLYVGSNQKVIDALKAEYGEQFAGK